jgi:hypothetical protein
MEKSLDRRRFLGTAALSVAAAELSTIRLAAAQTQPGTHTSFPAVKQIEAGELNIGYGEAGPANGTPVILPHDPKYASDFDGPNASGTAYREKFTGKYSHRILPGIGHDVPQEAPQAFADAIVAVDQF